MNFKISMQLEIMIEIKIIIKLLANVIDPDLAVVVVIIEGMLQLSVVQQV